MLSSLTSFHTIQFAQRESATLFSHPSPSLSPSLPLSQWGNGYIFHSLSYPATFITNCWGKSLRTHTPLCSYPVGSPAITHRIRSDFVLFNVPSSVNNSKAKPVNVIFIHQNTPPGYLKPGVSAYLASQSRPWNISTGLLFSLMLNISADAHM